MRKDRDDGGEGFAIMPRERLMTQGPEALTEVELLAILIGSGTRGRPAHMLGTELLTMASGRLDELGRMPPEAYALVPGIGQARAVTIAAALELGRRQALNRVQGAMRTQHIGHARDVHARFVHRLGDLQHEEFWVVLLRRSNRVLTELRVSTGGLSGTVVDPKVIFGKALALRAAALIVVHNHPSGNPRPSDSDRNLTETLREAGKFLDLPLLDHVIIARERYHSFADEGVL
jgi:DNA repair protein RadC